VYELINPQTAIETYSVNFLPYFTSHDQPSVGFLRIFCYVETIADEAAAPAAGQTALALHQVSTILGHLSNLLISFGKGAVCDKENVPNRK
jgi:hypothetical protein